MRNRRKAILQLETLESLTLLSGASASRVFPIVLSQPAEEPTPDFTGTTHGTSQAHDVPGGVNSDGTISYGGTNYDIKASGTLTSIGSAKVAGNLQVGTTTIIGVETKSDVPTGTLKLTTSKGTLTLQIPESNGLGLGEAPAATARNEVVESYIITQGTGAYRRKAGAGVVEFTFAKAGPDGGFGAGRLLVKFTGFEGTARTT